MSERLQSHESAHEQSDSAPQHEAHKPKVELDQANLEKQRQDQLEQSRDTAEKHSAPSKLLEIKKDEPTAGHDIATHHAIKRESYKSLLKHTQNKLPVLKRQFSKLIHQKQIETISNISGQTVARPSGLLGGGLGALAGSITLLYYSKYYGFRYNYAFFLITFLCGFLLGLFVEFLVRLLRRRA